MISTQIESRALATTEHWQRFLGDLRNFSAEPVPLETVGRLVRVAGLVLEATGIRLPVGSVCEVRMDGVSPVTAEVVGFNGDRAYLMPTGDVHGLASGARVIPRPTPVVPLKLGAAAPPLAPRRGPHAAPAGGRRPAGPRRRFARPRRWTARARSTTCTTSR